MQAKLLHVLQDGSFCRLGGRSSTQVDCLRILAATNINMEAANCRIQRFREDVYYRLNTLTITVPPLQRNRQRRDPVLDAAADSKRLVGP